MKANVNKTTGYPIKGFKIFPSILIVVLLLSGCGMPSFSNLTSNSTTVMEDLSAQVVLAIEAKDAAEIKALFHSDEEVADEKIEQVIDLYKGSMVSLEKHPLGSQRSRIDAGGSKDYLSTFLVTTTEAKYELVIAWSLRASGESGLYLLSLRTEDIITLP